MLEYLNQYANLIVGTATILLVVSNGILFYLNHRTYKLIKKQIIPDIEIVSMKIEIAHMRLKQYHTRLYATINNKSGARGNISRPILILKSYDSYIINTYDNDALRTVIIDGGERVNQEFIYTFEIHHTTPNTEFFKGLEAEVIYEDSLRKIHKEIIRNISCIPNAEELTERYNTR